ncbi:MAG: hypothetical protein WAW06_08845 [bacterium]
METPQAGPSSGPGQEVKPNAEDLVLVEKVARRVVGLRMSVPAIFFLESSKPLAFLGGQLLIFLEPFIQTLFNFAQYQRFALLMEDRDNWELLVRKLEDLEAEYSEKEKQEKKARKEAKRLARKQRGVKP